MKRSFDVSTEVRSRVCVAHFAARRDQAAQERQRQRVGPIAAHGQKDRPHLARRRDADRNRRHDRRQPVRRRIEVQRGAPHFGVEPVIDQQHPIVAVKLCRRGAAPLAVRAAHFEQVGKIILEQDGELQIDRPDRRNCARRAVDTRCRATGRSCAEYGRGPFPGRCAGRPSDRDWSDRRRTPNCRRAGWSRADSGGVPFTSNSRRDRCRVS